MIFDVYDGADKIIETQLNLRCCRRGNVGHVAPFRHLRQPVPEPPAQRVVAALQHSGHGAGTHRPALFG